MRKNWTYVFADKGYASRYKVEQTIGTLKRTYHFIRMRYIRLAKGDMAVSFCGIRGRNRKISKRR